METKIFCIDGYSYIHEINNCMTENMKLNRLLVYRMAKLGKYSAILL